MPHSPVYDPKQQVSIHINTLSLQTREQDIPVRVYQPKLPGPLPAIIDVHGGAWSSGDCTTNEAIDTALARSGLMVFAVGCRTAPEHPYPCQVVDVNYATRWLKANAETFNISPGQIGGMGTSSGGHSLFLSAMRPDDSRYKCLALPGTKETDAGLAYLIGAWPVLDPRARYCFARENRIDFLVEKTEGYFQSQDAMVEGNPQLALERGESLVLPPILMIQGTADENLPQGSAERFVKAWRAAGGDAQLELFPDMPHSFALDPGPESDRALELIKTFVSRQYGDQWAGPKKPGSLFSITANS